MLLCTLCLDRKARQHITGKLGNQNLDRLFEAAETFFTHLRTVENIAAEDDAMSSFTDRFQKILNEVKGA